MMIQMTPAILSLGGRDYETDSINLEDGNGKASLDNDTNGHESTGYNVSTSSPVLYKEIAQSKFKLAV